MKAHAADVRAQERRRTIRRFRRTTVNRLLGLAHRTGGPAGKALRVTAGGLERALKKTEHAVAPRRVRAPEVGGSWDDAAAVAESSWIMSCSR